MAKAPAFLKSLQKLNLGYSYANDTAFKAQWDTDSDFYRQLIQKIGLKVN